MHSLNVSTERKLIAYFYENSKLTVVIFFVMQKKFYICILHGIKWICHYSLIISHSHWNHLFSRIKNIRFLIFWCHVSRTVAYMLYIWWYLGPPPTTRTQTSKIQNMWIRWPPQRDLYSRFAKWFCSPWTHWASFREELSGLFNEKVIFVRKHIIIIGDVLAMAPYHGTT